MRNHLILILCFFSISPVFAQQPTNSIRGQIIDEASKTPMPFATVIVMGTEPVIGTTTDVEGYFTLKNLSIGRYDLKVTFIGYEPTIVKELTVSSAKEVYVTISIREQVTTLGELVIKPKVNKEQSLNAMTTVSARMLSVEEAKRYAGGFDDPARLASSFAGVASNVANNGIVVRGNAPKALQWKLEGVEIPNPNHFADLQAFGGGGLTALSSQMLANSDFLTGAFPAEYNNALSGVFDIYMRNGNSQQHEHTFQLGLIGTDFSSEGPFKKDGRSSYLFNYRYATLSLVSPLLPEDAAGTKYQDLSFKLNFPTKKLGSFSVWGIGLLDASGNDAETDSTKWHYNQDMEEGDAKQYMGAVGFTHNLFMNNNTELVTRLAATVSGLDWEVSRMNSQLDLLPQSKIEKRNWNFVFSSSINKKFSAKHTNKTGISVTGLQYDMLLKDADDSEQAPATVVDETGLSALLSAYTNSSFRLSAKLTANFGMNTQLFLLNNQFTLEPRLGVKWQLTDRQSFGFAYGLHSRLEKLNYYFTRASFPDGAYTNKNLDFTKAHHIVLSYAMNLSENMLLKVEPYVQYLFDVPVIPDSSFSFINLQDEWFLNEQLQNGGNGRNYGLDITLERYLADGYYFMLTGSIFNSEFKGGDGKWHHTRFNRNFLVNFLIGKEWFVGENKQNVFGINTRMTLQGGDRYSPVNQNASLQKQETVYDETSPFTKQLKPSFLAHLTISYKKNKAKSSRELALKILNATMYQDFYGFRYNRINQTIDEHRESILIPNLSYKIEF